MSVHNVREALGAIEVSLVPETPRAVLDMLDLDTYGFSFLCVTPEWIPPHVGINLTTNGRYTGIYRGNNLASRREGEPVELNGCHLAGLMGDEDGKGNNFPIPVDITTRPFRDGSNESYITAVLSRANGLTTGSVTSAPSPTKAGHVSAGDTARDLLDYACSTFTKEWRVNPDGTLDAAAKATLHPTTVTPTVVFTPGAGGRFESPTLTGIEAGVYRLDSDLEDWNSTVTVRASSTNALGSASISSNPYVGWGGSPLTMRRVVDSNLAYSTGSANNVAATQLGKWDETRRHVRITTDIYDIENYVRPGHGIYVYDVDQDLFDPNVQVQANGETIFPIILRVQGIRWSLQRGMGVYLRYWTGSAWSFFDLSDWVLWEDRPAELEIGDIYRTLPVGRRARRLNTV